MYRRCAEICRNPIFDTDYARKRNRLPTRLPPGLPISYLLQPISYLVRAYKSIKKSKKNERFFSISATETDREGRPRQTATDLHPLKCCCGCSGVDSGAPGMSSLSVRIALDGVLDGLGRVVSHEAATLAHWKT